MDERERGLDGAERAEDVDVEQSSQIVLVHFDQRADVHDSGERNHRIQAVGNVLFDDGQCGGHGVGGGDIDRQADDRAGRWWRHEIGGKYRPTALGEQVDDSAAESAARAGDENRLHECAPVVVSTQRVLL